MLSASRAMLPGMPEPDANDPAWEKRILWGLLVSVAAAIGLPVLWMNNIITLPVAVAIGGVISGAMFAWFARTLARERDISFGEALSWLGAWAASSSKVPIRLAWLGFGARSW